MDWNRNNLGARIVRRVVEILQDLQDYLPLTLRQIHYQLVAANAPGYANTQNKYKQLSAWLYAARVDGLIPWEAMTDRARPFSDLSGFSDSSAYLRTYLDHIRDHYTRDLMQNQAERLEIWTEKDALAAVLTRFAEPYRVSVQPCRGFGSGSQFDDVVRRNGKKPLRILYFGDYDPSGMWMSERDIALRLEDKHGLCVELDRIGLNRGQVRNLTTDPQRPKPTDTRSRWYIQNYGTDCWELDALPPAELGELVREAIESRINMALFEQEQEREIQDKSRVAELVAEWEDSWEK